MTFRLKPLDVAFMKAIHNKVNIVPVIAKADTLTLKERERLKKRVRAGLAGAAGAGRRGVWRWVPQSLAGTEPASLMSVLSASVRLCRLTIV